jgi:hypothetical protein
LSTFFLNSYLQQGDLLSISGFGLNRRLRHDLLDVEKIGSLADAKRPARVSADVVAAAFLRRGYDTRLVASHSHLGRQCEGR